MKILVDISKKCIQGGARRAYENRLTACLKASESQLDALEREVEALKTFLETTDFPLLRAAHPALAGGQVKEAFLIFSEPDRIVVEIDGQKIVVP